MWDISKTALQKLADPPVKVIGPQLGYAGNENSILIMIALPHRPDIDELECRLSGAAGDNIDPQKSRPGDNFFRNFVFTFNNLVPNQKYNYVFCDQNGAEIDLMGGLTYENCWFNAPNFNQDSKFVLLSCNNPFESGHSDWAAQFHMWERLNQRVGDDQNIKHCSPSAQVGQTVAHC